MDYDQIAQKYGATAPSDKADKYDQLAAQFTAPAPAQPVAPLSRTDKILKGIRDPIDGSAQLVDRALMKFAPDFRASVNRGNNWLADHTPFVSRVGDGGTDQMVRDDEAKYQQRRTAQGESGFDGNRMAGNIISPANLAIAARAPAAVSLAGRIGIGATSGAISGGMAPVAGNEDYWKEKAKQVGIGATLGGVIPALGSGLARLVSPNASKNASLKLLQAEGVNPTIGQSLGGWAGSVEEKLQSVPILGDMISRARRSANSDFESAAFNRALKPIGQELPGGLTGRDAVVHVEGALNDAYNTVLTKIGAIKPDAQFNAKLGDLQSMVGKLLMPPAQKQKFAAVVDNFKSSLDSNGVMTSDAYKGLESSLGTDARKLGSSNDIYEGWMAPAVKQLQQELRDMLKRQAGPSADELAASNAGWANFKRVQNAAAKIGAEDGKFTPAQFQNAVRTMDKSKDHSAFARGSALGQDLSDAGKTVLTGKVNDSGTTGRALMAGMAGGSAFVNPLPLAGLVAGGAMYSGPMQKALVYAATQRGASADAIADLLRKSSPYLSAAAAPVGLGLLDK